MLYFVVALGFVFYASLFLAWSTFHPAIDASTQTLASWRDVIFKIPDPTSLIILKEVLILAVAYLAFDALLAFTRHLRGRSARRAKTSWKNYKLPDYTKPL